MRRHFIGVLCWAFVHHVYAACAPSSLATWKLGSAFSHPPFRGFSFFFFYFILLFFTVCCTLRCLSDCQCCRRRRLVSLSSFLLVFPAAPIPSPSLSVCALQCVCVCVPLSFCIQNLLIPLTHSCFKAQIPYVAPFAAAFFTHRTWLIARVFVRQGSRESRVARGRWRWHPRALGLVTDKWLRPKVFSAAAHLAPSVAAARRNEACH